MPSTMTFLMAVVLFLMVVLVSTFAHAKTVRICDVDSGHCIRVTLPDAGCKRVREWKVCKS